MVANQVRTHSRSRRSLSMLKAVDKIVNIEDVLEDSLNDVVTKLNDDFKDLLSSDQDWAKLVKYATVAMDGSSLNVKVDHPTAMILEYGTPSQPMNSKIRPFTIEASKQVAEAVQAATKKVFG